MRITRRRAVGGALASGALASSAQASLLHRGSARVGVTPPTGGAFVASFVHGGPRGNPDAWNGMKVTPGANNLIISALGRCRLSGNSQTHTVKIVNGLTGTDLTGGSVSIDMSTGTIDAFKYVNLGSTVTMTGGVPYYVVSSEVNGGDQIYDDNSTNVTTTSDGVENGSIYSTDGVHYVLNRAGPATYGPVDFLYTVGPPAPLVGSPFPFLDFNNNGGQFAAISIRSGTVLTGGAMAVVQGTIGLDVFFAGDGGGGIPGINSVTAQWMIDGVAAIPTGYIQGPQQDPSMGIVLFPFTLDTTLYPDGTHMVYVRFIDSTKLDHNGVAQDLLTAYRYRSLSLTLVIANSGFNNGMQTIPVALSPGKPARVRSPTPDFITYPGTPTTCTGHPYPAPTVPPSSSAGLRDQNAYYYQRPARSMWDEYETQQQFATTPLGGVAVMGLNSDHGGTAENAYPAVLRDATQDGGRGENLVSAYVTFVPAPSASPYNSDGWFGVELQGRLFWHKFDGTVTTLAGLKRDTTKLPFDQTDSTLTEMQMFSRLTQVGTITGGVDFAGLVDLCIDPRNHNIVYLAKTLDHCILKVDLSGGPTATVYAGVDGSPGYLDGAAGSALFNEPYSIIMADGTNASAPIGTMFVADINNGCIRKIDPTGTTVSTLVGVSAGSPPSDGTIVGNVLFYSPHSTVAFASAYINTPQVIRFTSTGDIIVGEIITSTVRRINLVAQTVAWIASPNFDLSRGWIWMDVDRAGACGPLDDIIITKSITLSGTAAARMGISGSPLIDPFLLRGGGGLFEEGTHNVFLNVGPGYTWAVAFHDASAQIITSGFQIYSTNVMRAKLGGDPADPTGAQFDLYQKGHDIYYNGTPLCFPFASRPTFVSVNGPWGSGHLGSSVAPTFDDLVATYPTDGSFTAAAAGAGTLGAYIQGGMAGSVARPEITGNDLLAVCYFIRRTAASGCYPTPALPGTPNGDSTAAVISAVTPNRLTSTSIAFTWTTDKPTIGMAVAGSFHAQGTNTPYNVWSPMESSFSTSHSVTITGLPTGTMHCSILVKDIAGNSSYVADFTVA